MTRPQQARTGGWQYSVGSQQIRFHGPFPSYRRAVEHQAALKQRWIDRAVRLGGSFRELDAESWIIAMPKGVQVSGLRWCPADLKGRKRGDPRDDPPLMRRGPWKIR